MEFNGLDNPSANNANREETRPFTISVLTDNRSGLLNSVTIVFTRRKINIESINVSQTEIEGVSRYHIVIQSSRITAEKVTMQLRKNVEVLGAFLYEEEEMHFQELALYKVPTKMFMNNSTIENLVRNNGARILVIEKDHIVIEKTGHRHEIESLFEKLKSFNVTEFNISGRIAVSKAKRQTIQYIQQAEEASKQKLDS